jgi:hypothetical protein
MIGEGWRRMGKLVKGRKVLKDRPNASHAVPQKLAFFG